MRHRIAPLCAALTLAQIFAACNKDAATQPSKSPSSPSMAVVPTDAGTNQSHFVANGDFGGVNWFTTPGGGGGFVFGSLSVNRGGSVENPEVFLAYSVQQCDAFFSCTFIGGFGTIPSNDLTGGGNKQLHLNTNTSTDPNFFTFAGPTGVITVDWSANGGFSMRSTGITDLTFPGFLQHTNGTLTTASANTSGNVIGIPIPAFSTGSVGSSQNVIIDITH